MTSQPTPQELYDEGWCLIPSRSNKKPMLTSWKQYQLERPSKEQLYEWMSMDPAIWSGPTGPVSGRFSLDFDGEPGRQTLEKLGLTPHRSTPNGGYHVDFELPDWKVTTLSGKSKVTLGLAYPGLDTRGGGGYINLLGNTDTGPYLWLVEDRSPFSIDLLPDDLLYLIGKPKDNEDPPSIPIRIVQPRSSGPSPEGDVRLAAMALDQVEDGVGRNDAGFWLACQLRDNHFERPEAEVVMRAYVEMVPPTNAKGMSEPYTWAEALSSLNQAWSHHQRDSWLSDGSANGILVNNRQLDDLTAESKSWVLNANDPPILFRRGGGIVRVVEDEQHRVSAEPITPDALRNRLAMVVDWYRGVLDDPENSPTNVSPPVEVVKNLLAEEWPELPTLRDILEAPTLREDGTVLASEGFDVATGIWLAPPHDLDFPGVPDQPNEEDVNNARGVLEEMLREFAFTNEASKANAFGMVLTAVLRSAIPGLIPMALINAPIAGSGKTLLVNVASQIATGRPANLSSAPTGNDEELRKRITACLIAGDSMIVFDNLSGVLKSPILAQAITGPTWTDRVLGVSKTVNLEQRAMWVTTGNNVTLGDDMPRRSFEISLDPKMPDPWRKNYERTDLLEWVQRHRGELLAACLTIGRAWFANGKPIASSKPWNTFNGWQETIGGMLESAGVKGFLDNLEVLHSAADPDVARWHELLCYWEREFGGHPVRTHELDQSLAAYGLVNELPAVLAESLDAARDDNSRKTRLSQKLKSVTGRHFNEDGLRIERAGTDTHSGTALWRIVSAAQTATTDGT